MPLQIGWLRKTSRRIWAESSLELKVSREENREEGCWAQETTMQRSGKVHDVSRGTRPARRPPWLEQSELAECGGNSIRPNEEII